jgi:hypothetical protein
MGDKYLQIFDDFVGDKYSYSYDDRLKIVALKHELFDTVTTPV